MEYTAIFGRCSQIVLTLLPATELVGPLLPHLLEEVLVQFFKVLKESLTQGKYNDNGTIGDAHDQGSNKERVYYGAVEIYYSVNIYYRCDYSEIFN